MSVVPANFSNSIQSVGYQNQMLTINTLTGVQTVNMLNNQTAYKSFNRSDFLKIYTFEQVMYAATNKSVLKC